MSYTVLARRYRSETFDDVVGQQAAAQTLKNAIAADRLAHAYLFTGTRGVGKTSMARILAKALNCLASDKPTPNPCCKCESCLAVSQGDDIDVIEVDGASNNRVDEIRELRQNAIYRPARARFKVYIIDEVHMLTTGAFNALLKTLEEPPEHVKFIMATTEPNKVLPTILSRCQRFDFRNIQPADITTHLQKILTDEKIEAEEALVRRIARLARGSMRDALSLLDQILSMSSETLTLAMLDELLGTPRSESIIELADAVARGNLSDALLQTDQVLSQGLALDQLSRALQEHFRDLMVLRNCPDQDDLVDISEPALRAKMLEQAQLFDDATLVYNITVMEELHRSLKSAGSGRPLLEAAIVRVTAADRFSDTKTLLEQLQHLSLETPARPASSSRPATSQPAPSPATPPPSPAKNPAPPKPSAATAQPVQTDKFSPPANISLDYWRQHWQHLITRLDISLQAFIKVAQPANWDHNILTITFASNQSGMRNLLADHPDKLSAIEKALGSLIQQPLKVQLAQADTFATPGAPGFAPAATEPPSPPATTKASPPPPPVADVSVPRSKSPPGARPSQDEINAALSEPHVRDIQEILNGKVRHVERQPKEQ